LSLRVTKNLQRVMWKVKFHPLDLKNAVAEYLNLILEPIRNHFEKDEKARKLYEIVKNASVTR